MIGRMVERLGLLKAEVEGRGVSWMEFRTPEEVEKALAEGEGGEVVNGTAGEDGDGMERSSAWTDGTLQTGRIVNGEVRMDEVAATNGTGGRLDDEALRRAMEERMRHLAENEDQDGGMHL